MHNIINTFLRFYGKIDNLVILFCVFTAKCTPSVQILNLPHFLHFTGQTLKSPHAIEGMLKFQRLRKSLIMIA